MNAEQRAKLFAMRRALDGLVEKIADAPAEINENMAAIRPWQTGAYVIGDVRMYEGIPYKCVQAHDSTGNDGWTPAAVPALWMQYHGTTPETARSWVAPAGAHDMYKRGEYMIWTDGMIYPCNADTVYSPADYRAAWGDAIDPATI